MIYHPIIEKNASELSSLQSKNLENCRKKFLQGEKERTSKNLHNFFHRKDFGMKIEENESFCCPIRWASDKIYIA